jgi:micrococcal nuclease
MKKKIIVCVLVLVMVLSFTAVALATSYVGASTSDKFHYRSCEWAKKIKHGNRIFFSSRQAAINAGYTPCRVCSP